MIQREPAGRAKSVSDLLSAIELRGQAWCYSDLGKDAAFSVPPGEAAVFHAMLHGSVRIACAGGTTAELRAGDIVMVLSGEAHALRTGAGRHATTHEFLRDEPSVDVPPTIAMGSGLVSARVLSGKLRASWPGEVGRATLPSLLRLGHADNGPLSLLLRPEAVPLAGIGAGSAALLTRLAEMMLIASLRADPRCGQLFAPPQQDPIADALRLIEASPADDWTVERLARAVGMGRSNFAARFTQQIGRAPMEVVAEQRMEHAASLLRLGKLKIAEISEMAGYGSEAAFSRRFTRHFGISPSQMRDRARLMPEDVKPAGPAFQTLLGGRTGKGAAAVARQRAPAALHGTVKLGHKTGILLGQRD